MSHVFLVGFMGAGKSTVGHMLSEHLELPFVDIDECVVSMDGRSIQEIFAEEGEPAFRRMETEALRSLDGRPASIVACGGGVILADKNRALLARLGRVVYLVVSPGEALARIGGTESRPLLAGAGGVVAATALLQARESLYRAAADLVIDTGGRSAREVAAEATKSLGEVGSV